MPPFLRKSNRNTAGVRITLLCLGIALLCVGRAESAVKLESTVGAPGKETGLEATLKAARNRTRTLKSIFANSAKREKPGTFLHHALNQRAAEMVALESFFDTGPFSNVSVVSTSTFLEASKPLISYLGRYLKEKSLSYRALTTYPKPNVASPWSLVPLVADFFFAIEEEPTRQASLLREWTSLLSAPNVVSVVPTPKLVSNGELLEGVLHGAHPGWLVTKRTMVDGVARSPLEVFMHDVDHSVVLAKALLGQAEEAPLPTWDSVSPAVHLALLDDTLMRTRIAAAVRKELANIDKAKGPVVVKGIERSLASAAQSTDGYPNSLEMHVRQQLEIRKRLGVRGDEPPVETFQVVEALLANRDLSRRSND